MQQFLSDVIREEGIKNPSTIAVHYDNESFSYADLEVSANRLAHYLEKHKVTQGDIVALYLRRSFDVLVAMLAIWKVGATYLSLDFETPVARLDKIIDQSKPKCIVTEPALLNELSQGIPVITCQDPEYLNFGASHLDHQGENDQQAAYLIYTSGSTGQPKGVSVTHANLANYIFWFNEHFHITKQDIFNFNSSPAFDFAITCIHAPLVAGAQILITSEVDALDAEAYFHQLIKHRVTFVKWTPSYFKILIDYVEKYKPDLSSLRYLMIAGEELLTTYVQRWFSVYPAHTVINEYGPTETTVGITTCTITSANLDVKLKTIPIGQPIRNTNFYVVDSNHSLIDKGEVGELFIGGDSVSSGYYNAEELTQERFIKNPFSTQGDILYKTGDLVRQLPDGNYMYVGRIDNQVKINGYRVEVSEIEHCLLQHSEISHACVTINQSQNDNQYIEAYVVLKSQAAGFVESEVRQHVSRYLPQFMLPRRYYHVSRIPLTANGKVSYSALVEGVKHLEMEQDV